MPGFRSKSLNAIPVWIADDNGNPVAIGGGGGGGGEVTQPTASALNAQVVGNVANGAADSGNPVKVAGVFRAAPANLSDGQRADVLTDEKGNVRARVQLSQWTGADGFANASLGRHDRFDQPGSALIPGACGFVFNGTAWDRQRGDTNGAWNVLTGSAAAAVGIAPVVATNATSLVVKASAGNFYGGSIVAGATAGFLIAYNAAAAPAAGAALTAAQILGVVQVSANGSAALGEYTIPDRFGTGVVLLFSTALATYTVPANAAQFLRGRAM